MFECQEHSFFFYFFVIKFDHCQYSWPVSSLLEISREVCGEGRVQGEAEVPSLCLGPSLDSTFSYQYFVLSRFSTVFPASVPVFMLIANWNVSLFCWQLFVYTGHPARYFRYIISVACPSPAGATVPLQRWPWRNDAAWYAAHVWSLPYWTHTGQGRALASTMWRK